MTKSLCLPWDRICIERCEHVSVSKCDWEGLGEVVLNASVEHFYRGEGALYLAVRVFVPPYTLIGLGVGKWAYKTMLVWLGGLVYGISEGVLVVYFLQ